MIGSASQRYRPDIDGLRAIAVLSVVLYHLKSNLLKGGFVGVDIFFVISGFLITGIIRNRIDQGRFSFLDFYSGRIRRIFPSLLLVFAFAFVLGWFVLFSWEYRDLSDGVFYGSLFWTNISLLTHSGYFNRSSEFNPFLHLWSLGIEEQFYLFWPLAVMLFRGRWRAPMIIGLSAVSFVLGIVLTTNGSFYLPVARFWELGLGCMLAFQFKEELPQKFSNLKSVTGLGLILFSVLFLKSTFHFPGYAALLPTVGACLLIAAGSESWVNRAILSHPIAVFLGLISYPLYLWHWPLLYFVRMTEAGNPAFSLQIGAVALSVVLAWASYRFMEIPIRQWAEKSKKPVPLLFAANLILMGVSLITFKTGNPHHTYDAMRIGPTLDPGESRPCGVSGLYFCTEDSREAPRYALWGDSHAGVLYPGLVRTSQVNGRWMVIQRPGCVPIISAHPERSECEYHNLQALQNIASRNSVEWVLICAASRLISADAARYVSEDENVDRQSIDEMFQGFSRSIHYLESRGKRVGFLVDNPAITNYVDFCFPRDLSFTYKSNPACGISRAQYDAATGSYRSLVQKLKAAFPYLVVFDFTDLFCDDRNCEVIRNGRFYYRFSDHISEYAAELIGARLADRFSRP